MVVRVAAHTAGTYHVTTPGTGSFLLDGTELIKDLGFGGVKYFMSDKYASQDYTFDTWGAAPTTLKELAQKSQFATAFGDSTLKHYLLNCFTFVNDGTSDLWRFGFQDQTSFLQDEYDEIKELAEHLITTYANTGKTFVIQNWEGDWALMGTFVAADHAFTTKKETDYMVAWLQTRQQAVEDARRNLGQTGVTVKCAVEVNRIVDAMTSPNMRRVLHDVLPRLSPDLVSWSAYDGIYNLGDTAGEGTFYTSEARLISKLQTKLNAGVNFLQDLTDAEVYFGEWGVAENDLPVGYSDGNVIEAVYDVATDLELPYDTYWQVFDNEGTPPSNSGYWLYDDNGDLTEAGTKYQSLLA